MDKGINKEFLKLLEDPKVRFTIILGAGFHRQALGGNSVLSDWGKLLLNQDPELNLTGFFPLDFEQLVIRRTGIEKDEKLNNKPAFEIEKRISKEICLDIKHAQEKALKFKAHCYPTFIFNPEIISDIISLNFDTTAEELCCSLETFKKSKKVLNTFDSSTKPLLNINHWEVPFKNKGKIRFWYPHGTVHDKDNITLGTREYAKRLETIERLRNHSKSEKKDEPTSWYHQLTHNPVLILGADMSKDEWDIWFALVNRDRNFAKSENTVFKYPIFQMRECECNPNYRHQWFKPLSIDMKFESQWRELENQINKTNQ